VPRFLKHSLAPLIILLTVNLAVGFLTFRAYGLSWDEPLFYDYADAIRLAYTPQAFAPNFDFNQVYGPSPEDHKFYGPAYLLLARPVQQAVMTIFKADRASAWHLVNFLTFQVGLVFFFFLLRRWLTPWPAGLSTAFFAWQPVFWGHAFINPKDMPFMVFFVAAITLGLAMVDRLPSPGSVDEKTPWGWVLLAGCVLGCTAAIRIIGPLAGGLIFLYWLTKGKISRPRLGAFTIYGLVALLTMFSAWPYLWADPLNRFIEVLRHMSNNPTQLAVLFMGQSFPADALPRRYFPQLLALTLTEPTWLLFLTGILVVIRNFWLKKWDWRVPALLLLWFGLMFVYILILVPPMYDGYRHFLFSLPPVFAVCGFAIHWLWEQSEKLKRFTRPLAGLLLIPGLLGMAQLHPYEYAYYNSLAGGPGGAYRTYETDYWLTCYKEATDWVRTNAPEKTLHIQREFEIAAYYGSGLKLQDLSQETENDPQPGDLLLFSTRANLDIRSIYRKLPVVHAIGRNGAEFCLIKRKD
jgi:hypothetical protein